MTTELGFWQEVWRGVLTSSAVSSVATAIAWGAAGGFTSALAVKVGRRAFARQVAMGALVAAGTGTMATALVVKVFGLDPALIPVSSGFSPAVYLVGVFGPAIIEVVLRRIGGGRLPGEGPSDGSA